MTAHHERDETLAAIRKSHEQKLLIPFVGSGLSMCVEGFPSWDDLLQELLKEIGDDKAKVELFEEFNDVPWARAEYFAHLVRGGNHAVHGTIKKVLEDGQHAVWNNKEALKCQMLLATYFRRIYTTNYDRLLERAGELSGRPGFVSICDAKSAVLSRYKRNHTILEVIKFHGDYGEPETMVLTEANYYGRLLDVDAKDILLMSDLLFHDLLFVGYSLQDPSLKYLLHQMRRLMLEIDPTIMSKECEDWRPRLFFLTTDARESFVDYNYKAYGATSICVLKDCPLQETNDTEDGSLAKLRFQSRSLNALSGTEITIGTFDSLWALAMNSYLDQARFETEAKKHFPSATPTELGMAAKHRKGFRTLRSRVMHSCYSQVLDRLLTTAKV